MNEWREWNRRNGGTMAVWLCFGPGASFNAQEPSIAWPVSIKWMEMSRKVSSGSFLWGRSRVVTKGEKTWVWILCKPARLYLFSTQIIEYSFWRLCIFSSLVSHSYYILGSFLVPGMISRTPSLRRLSGSHRFPSNEEGYHEPTAFCLKRTIADHVVVVFQSTIINPSSLHHVIFNLSSRNKRIFPTRCYRSMGKEWTISYPSPILCLSDATHA